MNDPDRRRPLPRRCRAPASDGGTTHDPAFDAAVKRLDHPVFRDLRTTPLPTLPARRREMRERLAAAEAAVDRLLQQNQASPGILHAARMEAAIFRRMLSYLGAPDPRLDLYRTFNMPLPAPRPPEQLRLPLHKPRGGRG
jgi:hypothetical protein